MTFPARRQSNSSLQHNYARTYSYDAYGRLSTARVQSDTSYTFGRTYDTLGRVATRSFPTGFALRNSYNAQGYLASVSNNATGGLLWRANSADAVGPIFLAHTLVGSVATQLNN